MHTGVLLFISATALAGSGIRMDELPQALNTPTLEKAVEIKPSHGAKSCQETIARIKSNRGFPEDGSKAAAELNILKAATLKIAKYDSQNKQDIDYVFTAESLEQSPASIFPVYAKEFPTPEKERGFKNRSRAFRDACIERAQATKKKFDYNECFAEYFNFGALMDKDTPAFNPVNAFMTPEETLKYESLPDDAKKVFSTLALRRAHCMGTENKPYRKLTQSWVSPNQIVVRTEGCAYDANPFTHPINGTLDYYVDVSTCRVSRIDRAPELPLSKKPKQDVLTKNATYTLTMDDCTEIAALNEDRKFQKKHSDPQNITGRDFIARQAFHVAGLCEDFQEEMGNVEIEVDVAEEEKPSLRVPGKLIDPYGSDAK